MKRMAETADVTAWKYADEPDVTPGEAEKMLSSEYIYRKQYSRYLYDICCTELL